MEGLPQEYYPWPFHFPSILIDASLLRESFDQQMVIWGSYSFSGPLHYDQSCHGSMSVQHIGRKRWWLWAPWEVEHDNGTRYDALTRFTAILNPNEILVYAPAWYHQTETLDNALSIATVFFLKDPPFNGRLPDHFRSPRGFEACADALGGWRWRDRAWDPLLAKAHKDPKVFARAEAFVRCMLEQGPEEEGVCVTPTVEEIAERLKLEEKREEGM
uniref:JmjC domain-containing protein n=1 Tax=Lotharella oceanica TaxID=641309 RepID=A0A7S2XF47_9EUKA|mmetsp:Transcript_33886/g.62905  ORF Transcript_33886/g.62905 Transcript_33886/m.62905 type:complete len:216 (+) Transcript_33886:77-724(+)